MGVSIRLYRIIILNTLRPKSHYVNKSRATNSKKKTATIFSQRRLMEVRAIKLAHRTEPNVKIQQWNAAHRSRNPATYNN
jgi:hypothetical protein